MTAHVRGQSGKTIAELESLITELEALLLGLSQVVIPLAEESFNSSSLQPSSADPSMDGRLH